MIEVESLVKRYGGVAVVDGVSFSVAEGEVFGILGPNGAGKTTTVEMVAGLRDRDAGSIRVLGRDPADRDPALKEQLGVQLQAGRLPDRITVAEVVDLYSSFYRNPVPWRGLIERLGLGDRADARYGTLSGGQQQRLAVALALVGNPRVAILDELTTGLDPQARRDTWAVVEEVRDAGVTVVLVTHFMEEAERLCDRIAVIDRGRVAALDTPAGIVAAVDTSVTLRFRPSVPLDDGELLALPGVSGVTRRGEQVEVSGGGDTVYVVISHLARRHIVAEGLRVDQAGLDDAFVAITTRLPEPAPEA